MSFWFRVKRFCVSAMMLALMVPAVARAQSVVVITPGGGSVSGTFVVTVEACDPYARGFAWHTISYGSTDVTSEFSGGPTGAPSWCLVLGDDVWYEVYTAELTVICGAQMMYATFVDIQDFGGNDDAMFTGTGCESADEQEQETDFELGSSVEALASRTGWDTRIRGSREHDRYGWNLHL